MIPSFGLGDVLPPFVGSDVTGERRLPRSPYPSSIVEFADAFCTTKERAVILKGLLAFRAHLRALGFISGYQWIDGSFVENCEAVRGRAPGDVDVVSLLRRPPGALSSSDWSAFFGPLVPTTFNADWTKANFRCDAYHIDLDDAPQDVARNVAYWNGLFSHQRDTFRWKGMVEIPFIDQDDDAELLVDGRVASW